MMSGVKRFLHKLTADKLRENGAIVPDIDEVNSRVDVVMSCVCVCVDEVNSRVDVVTSCVCVCVDEVSVDVVTSCVCVCVDEVTVGLM